MNQNNNQRQQKTQKKHSQKNIQNTEFFTVFDNEGLSRMSLDAQDVHNDSPTEIQITKERNPNLKPQDFNILTKTKQSILKTKAADKKKQKMTPFWGPPSPTSQGSK